MMRTIYLYGILADDFGGRWRLDVHSAAEACRAIEANRPGFLAAIRHLPLAVARGDELGRIENLDLAAALLEFPAGDFHIAPAIAGAGFWDDFGQLVIGGLALAAAVTFWGIPGTALLVAGGLSFTAAGIVNLLTPSQQTPKSPENDPSYLFAGPTNKTTQGLPVPLAYGEVVVGSIVISEGIRVEEA